MDEFNFDNNFEIGTSISKIKNKKIKQPKYNDNNNNNNNNTEIINLIKDLETRLDDIESLNIHETIQINTDTDINKKNSIKSNKKKESFNYKDVIIYMLFFIIINNQFFIEFIYKFPYINKNSPYPNLFIRTFIFGLSVYLFKKYF